MRRLGLVVIVTFFFLLASAPVLAGSRSVAIRNLKFDPAVTQVNVGDTVTWTNFDSVLHIISWRTAGPADSLPLSNGGQFTVRFDVPGTYSYVCGIHGDAMTGVVIVQGPSPSPTPSASPPTTPTPTPSPSPSPSASATPSGTPSATATPAPSAARSTTPSPSPTALVSPVSWTNPLVGLGLVGVGVAILAGALWWRFGHV